MISVFPMAGHGSRFIQAGVTTPKPLIDVFGKPMYSWAVESMPLNLTKRLIFICQRTHLEECGLEADIRQRYAALRPVIVPLDTVTEGQACTVLTAKEYLPPNESLLIFNADTYCKTDLNGTLPTLSPDVAGILGVFRAEGDRWSFARTDEQGRVVETAEKKRISNLACTGLYWFRTCAEYIAYAEKMIQEDRRVKNEFYVAPIYNLMIEDGLEVRVDVASEAAALGTPEDLAAFKSQFEAGMLRPNTYLNES